MFKFLRWLFVFVCVALPAHADPIYHNFFTVVDVIGAGTPYQSTSIYEFTLPIGDVPNSTYCDLYGCRVQYLDVPYYYTNALTLAGAGEGEYPNFPPLGPNAEGLPTATISFQYDGVEIGSGENQQITVADTQTPFTTPGWGPATFINGTYVDFGRLPDRYLIITSDTPEPSTFILLGTGLIGFVGATRRKYLCRLQSKT